MSNPTHRKTQIKLDLNELKNYLQASRLALGEMPELFWFDIRNDQEQAFVAGRVKIANREYSFRIPSAKLEGDTSNWTFPVDFKELFAADRSGEITVKFQLPAVLLCQEGKKRRAVGVAPHTATFSPFPTNGEYQCGADSIARVGRLLEIRRALGINEHFRLRCRSSVLQVYVSNGPFMLRTSIDVDAEPSLWDVEIPMLVAQYLGRAPGIIIDHMHGYGTWFSDGKSFYFAQKSASPEVHDYTFDVPGAAGVVTNFNRTFPLSPEFRSALSEGPNLVVLRPGLAQVSHLSPEKMNYHEHLEITESADVAVNFRGEPSAVIIDGKVLNTVSPKDTAVVYVSPFPCSPYVIQESPGVDIMVVPPEVNPESFADALGSDFQACGDVLRAWEGDYDGLVPIAFRGSPAPDNVMYPNPPIADMDALFLVKVPEGFIRAGGVSVEHLATCLFEFCHSKVYQQKLVEQLLYRGFWPGLQIFVYDPEHTGEYGVDPTSPWKDWIGWRFWSDPKGEIQRDDAGRPVEKEQTERRKVHLSAKSLTAPQIITSEDPPKDPITTVEAVPVEETVVTTQCESEATKYLLIDGNFVTWRDFYSKGLERMSHPISGRLTGVVFGFLRSTRSWIQQFNPSHVCVVWDDGIAGWRKELVPDYKDRSDRKKKLPQDRLESMFEQRGWLQENLANLGVHSIKVPGSEADDIISLLADAHKHLGRTVIITGDYDFNHLVTETTHVYQARQDVLISDVDTAQESLMTKVIVGDSSDRIPGVPKVGEKSVAKFAEELRKEGKEFTVENIVEAAADHSNWRIRLLTSDEATAVMQRNLKMIDLRYGASKLDPTQMMLAIQQSLQPVCINPVEFGKWLHELAFNSIISDVSSWHADLGALS
jgi:5'-3' exonuclease